VSNLEFSDKELAAIKATYCPGFTDQQFEVAMTFCRVRNLLPGKHVIFQLRSSKEWDEAANAKVPVTKIIFMTTIDASRLIAERTKLYNGQAPEQYIYLDDNGSPSIISEIPLPMLPLPAKGTAALPREPWAVKTTVYRKDFSQPVSSIARFDAYAATYNTKDGPKLNDMWARRGPEQLAKCSEMLSLRKAFPEELGGIYIAEEFKPDADEVVTQPISPAVAVPLPPAVPKVDHTPAQGTDTARPGEVKVEYHAAEVPATLPEHSGSTLVVKSGLTGSKKDAALHAIAQTVGPEKAAEFAKTLTPASELPTPPKKRGPKPKEKSPDNGQSVAGAGITDTDLAAIGTPAPPEITEGDRKAGQDFVESADPTPTKEEMAAFTARVRALAAAGAHNADLKNYILDVGKKSDPKKLTVNNWETALSQLEALDKDKLKEVTKNAPLPTEF